MSRPSTATALLLFLALSLILTFPLPLHLASAVEDRQDALLNVWITAWDGHQLLADPTHLFEANIFYPYHRTLAYSELLLGNGLIALPITAASGNPVLGYNMALLLSFILSGLGTYLLVRRLTRSSGAGLVAGILFAFCSYRMTNLAQAQLLTTQWLPFALLALHDLVHHPRLRHVATFVLFFCLQALSSFYYAFLLALTILAYLIWGAGLWLLDRSARRTPAEAPPVAGGLPPAHAGRRRPLAPREWARAIGRSPLGHLALAACCCSLIVLPFALPYFQVQAELGFERTLADNEPFSASLQQYLLVPPHSLLHSRWLPSDETPRAGGYAVDALFPGIVALALAVWGLACGRGRSRWFFLLLLLGAFVLSLGPRLYTAPGQPAALGVNLPYAWLYAVVPGFKALRAPVRFDALVMLALAALAGYGVASLRRPWAAPLLAGLVALESLVWPAAHAEPVPVGSQVPPVYRWLASQPAAPILELPMPFTPGGPQLDYQYLSTYHWLTTPTGYSGFIPPKHGQIVYEMERFPSERSVSLLQALEVRTLILYAGRIPASQLALMESALASFPELAAVQAFGQDRVYEVQPRAFAPTDLEVQVHFPARVEAGQSYTAYVILTNQGQRSFAVQPTTLLEPQAVWEGQGARTAATAHADLPLVTSPGGAAVIPVALDAPIEPGTYRLSLGEQDGPIGSWAGYGSVDVGDQMDNAFPVPARLAAWNLSPADKAGQPLEVSLTWLALGKIDAYYSVYVKLLDAAGNAVAGWDGQPQDGQTPTLLWVPGETIDDRVVLTVPGDAAPGDYVVEVGMYRAEDLARCLTLNPDGEPVDRVTLGVVQIEP